MTYLESCTKYFAPIDEIIEAMDNEEGVAGLSFFELKALVESNINLQRDIAEF